MIRRRPRTTIRLVFLLALGGPQSSAPQIAPVRADEPALPAPSEWSKEKKLRALNTAVIGGVTAYGLLFWGYGEGDPRVVSEDWFGINTKHGGADKLGHVYTCYLGTMAFAALCERWGFEPADASRHGALSSMTAMTMMEVGDMFTQGGFSFEDLTMDAVGAALGYLRRTDPVLRSRLDFRAEYLPSKGFLDAGGDDFLTDYAGYKYLLALRADGFENLSPRWLKYFELHAGYFTRGYEKYDLEEHTRRTRNIYLGVGINLSHLLEKQGRHTAASVLSYYQLPHTYATSEKDLNY